MNRRTISNSTDLLRHYPILESQKGWTQFAIRFDKPECRKNRSIAARASAPKRQPEAIREILNHCFLILRGEMIAGFPEILPDGTERYLSSAEELEQRLKSATSLAEKVELIFSDSEDGVGWRKGIMQEGRRLKSNPESRSLFLAWQAFFHFLDRQGRLPTKKELNWEVNRRKNRVKGYRGKKEFGDSVYLSNDREGGDRSRADKYMIYDCYEDYCRDENEDVIVWMECELVPLFQWKVGYWDEGDFSRTVLKAGGFSGLPKSGKPRKSQVGDG